MEEFLQGLLYKHDVVLGYPEGMKSPDTVVLSSHSHGGPDDVMDPVASDMGGTVAPSTKHGRGTSNSQPPEGEEEAPVDSTNRQRSGIRAVATPSASNGGATWYSKIPVSKAAATTKATLTPAKVVITKKNDATRKK